MRLAEQRSSVVELCQRLVAERLVVGTAGNVSVRVGDLVAVTPSGLDYGKLTPDLVGVHRLDGSPVDAPLAPTSELPMHLAVYAATDAGAIVHTHSMAATALSCLVEEIPPVHYYLALFGGTVRVAPYAPFGSPELAAGMVRALTGRTGCLLGNHGAVTIGTDLDQAYQRASYLEWLCEVALRVLSVPAPPAPSTAGAPRLLSPAQLDEALTLFRDYGQQPPNSA